MLFAPFLKSYNSLPVPGNPEYAGGSSITRLAQTLFDSYLVPFEATSVLILIAIIGVVVLAKRQPVKK